ncbi:hypothetical protein [Pontimicrobium sp. MEBiC06410]
MKKTLENVLNFKKVTVLDLNQMNRIIGGVGGDGDDDDNRTRTVSSKVCAPNEGDQDGY